MASTHKSMDRHASCLPGHLLRSRHCARSAAPPRPQERNLVGPPLRHAAFAAPVSAEGPRRPSRRTSASVAAAAATKNSARALPRRLGGSAPRTRLRLTPRMRGLEGRLAGAPAKPHPSRPRRAALRVLVGSGATSVAACTARGLEDAAIINNGPKQ